VRCTDNGSEGTLVDATDDASSMRRLIDAIGRCERSTGQVGVLQASIVGNEVPAFDGAAAAEPRKIGSERRYTTIRYDERYILRLVRRIDEGINTELEMSRFLTARETGVAPRLVGDLQLVRAFVGPMAVGVLHAFVPNAGTAWQLTVEELRRYFDRVLARPSTEPCPPPPVESPLRLAGQTPPQAVGEMMGNYRDTAAQLGVRVAELHLALAEGQSDPAFAPEPYSALDRRSKYQSLRNLSGRVLRTLRDRLTSLSPLARKEAETILAREADVIGSFEPLLHIKMSGVRIRTHGDLHLGHVLYTGKSFVVTDFDGLEVLTLAERRRKRSPLRDLAWMARSFEMAAFRRLLDATTVRESDIDAARPWALHWSSWASASFLQAYLERAQGAPFLPADRDEGAVLFDAFVLERALYQLRADLDEQSPAITVSLLGIAHALASRHQG